MFFYIFFNKKISSVIFWNTMYSKVLKMLKDKWNEKWKQNAYVFNYFFTHNILGHDVDILMLLSKCFLIKVYVFECLK